MKIKLKQNSSVEIVNKDGYTIAKINEDGSIEGGATKLYTHSFDELSPALKQIVEDAIADAWDNGIACTQQQWSNIKALFDKSLYLNYYGVSMIKTIDGMSDYVFGNGSSVSGYYLTFLYDSNTNLLYAKYEEV
jgi:hypothetical protein